MVLGSDGYSSERRLSFPVKKELNSRAMSYIRYARGGPERQEAVKGRRRSLINPPHHRNFLAAKISSHLGKSLHLGESLRDVALLGTQCGIIGATSARDQG